MVSKLSFLVLSFFLFSCKKETHTQPKYSVVNPYISEPNLRKMNLIKDSIQWVEFKMVFSDSEVPKKHHAYAYSDDQHKGGSKIKVKSLKGETHCFEYSLNKLDYPYYPYTGWGQNFDENLKDTVSKFKWISYSYKGVIHSVQPRLSSVLDYAHYRIFLPEAPVWTKALISLDELTQPSFAKKVAWNPELLYATDWLIQGSDGEIGSLCIGNIKFGYLK